MGASSVTGVSGPGASKKYTTKELAILSNGPIIQVAGTVESDVVPSSPPSESGTVTFPEPLQGPASNYVIMLTTRNGGNAYVNQMFEDDNDNFTGFNFVTEADCTVMYTVINTGFKPNIIN